MRYVSAAVACVGAVIGAGFASGREIVVFFTRYGVHSWGLIALSVIAITALCYLCLRLSRARHTRSWCELYGGCSPVVGAAARICGALLMAVTGGAMVSASGHMMALLWWSDWAYPVGAVGTLMVAYSLGFGTLRPLSVISGVLTAAFVAVVILVLRHAPEPSHATLSASTGSLAWAAVSGVAYAAMNLTLSIGVVCKCAVRSRRGILWISGLFGAMLCALLCLSNALYLRHPELWTEAFPVVRLLTVFGQTGYVAGVVLLYLAIFTTLIAILYALRCVVEAYVPKCANASASLTLGLPMAISLIGFEGIVQSLYAPAGILCLLLVFLPLAKSSKSS